MAALDDARINAPEERPSGHGGARRMTAADTGEDEKQIRVPRLLVAASEISWRVLVCVAAFAVLVFALLKVGFVVIPVVVALLLSTLFVPPARALERRGVPRALAASVVFLGGILVIVGLVALVAAPIAADAENLADQVKAGADKLAGQVASLPVGMDEQEIQRQVDSIDDRLRENNGALRSGVISAGQAAGQFLAGLIFTLVVLFFFIKDGPGMWRWFVGRFPKARKPALDELGGRSWHVLTAYVRGVVAVATIDAVGIGIGLAIIGVPLVLPLAALTFVLAFIPIVGAIVAGAAAALVALAFKGAGAALLVIGLVILVQQLEGNVFYPVIVGKTLSLHPLVVLLAVTIGGVLYGVVGAALAVPIAVVAAAAVQVIERHSVHGEVAVGPPPVQGDPA